MTKGLFNKIVVLGFLCTLFILMSQESYGQILKDRGKLKTTKSPGGGFVLFERKIKTQSKKRKVVKNRNASTPGRRGSVKKSRVNPGFSRPLFGSRIRSSSPRFSKKRFVASNGSVVSSGPQKRKVRKKLISPRYSSKPRGAVALASGIRYSPKRKKGKKEVVSPRFSPGARAAITLAQGVRYSAKPKRGKKVVVAPRFSPKGRGAITLAQGVRYSAKPKRGKKVVVAPRFSPKAGDAITLFSPPRYSENPNKGKKPKISPRYSNNKYRSVKIIAKPGFNIFHYVLAIPGGVVLAFRPYNDQIGIFKGWLKRKDLAIEDSYKGYQGEAKTSSKFIKNYRAKRRSKNYLAYDSDFRRKTRFFEKFSIRRQSNLFSGLIIATRSSKNQKASYNNARLATRKQQTKATKNLLKKINKFRIKVDGNKVQPPSVRGRSKKVKFDKKEKGLWYE